MSMIVARMQKMKAGNLIGIGNHNKRKTENHSNKDIDTDLSDLNYDLVDVTKNYKKDIEQFINENKSSPRAIRKDAVLINEWIISSDKNFFENLTDEDIKKFFEGTKHYFGEKFGDQNIRYANVHLDETTPHMHMGVVPFDYDNNLSAKRVFNRQALRDVQDELPKYLQTLKFEIERGREGSERKNLTVPEFKEMKKEQEKIEQDIKIKKDELLAYTKDVKVDRKFNVVASREKKEVEIETDEKNLFGKLKMKKIQKPTGNLIISEKDFDEIAEFTKNAQDIESRFKTLLKTDIYKENQFLHKKIDSLLEKNDRLIEARSDSVKLNNKHVDMYHSLQEDNNLLNAQISELRQEIKLIYQTTKEFLKVRTNDFEAFKSIFKDLRDSILATSKKNNINSTFNKEFDNENKKNRDITR